MQFYRINNVIDYPVGINISKNLVAITEMANKLREVYPNSKLCLWCMGSSGAIIAGIISSMILDCTISHVKKEGENSHSSGIHMVKDDRINIIVDDFVDSGRTIKTIIYKMERYNIPVEALCVTGYLYRTKLFPEIKTYFALTIKYFDDGVDLTTDSKFK